MSKNKIIGWSLIVISVLGIILGIDGVYSQINCVKNSSPDFPICGVIPSEMVAGIFSVVPLVLGVTFLRKKDKSTE